jgi:hypothetical protein
LLKQAGDLKGGFGKMGGIWRWQGREKFFVFYLELAPIISNCSGIAPEMLSK